jgi:hypothetical protein
MIALPQQRKHSPPSTESFARYLRTRSLLDLRLKEHATRIAWQLACVRHDSGSVAVFAAEHSAILSELKERGVLR